MTDAAILFEPDGYVQATPKLMGRQAAGHGFLRAAVRGRSGDRMWGYTPHKRSAEVFAREVKAVDPAAKTHWCPAHRLDLLEEIGQLYIPGPDIASAAQLRLRRGIAAYSICGVTHTTASHRAMTALSTFTTEPVMPWDALICTSSAVAETLRVHRAAEADYLTWRLGTDVAAPQPQTPVIPLGVHTEDFAFTQAERAAARAALDFASDEIVALFVGRLSFHAKAHPDAMYAGLEAAARRTGTKVALLQAGWFANEAIERAFKEGAAAAAPSVRPVYADGRDPQQRRHAWAAADIFISLSDNIQETFGLTPIEAMAAGLPVVVTDWDGYKDTVRDGVDGFRIPTWMPEGSAPELALRHESGSYDYDFYCAMACQTVAVDMPALVEKLVQLIEQPELRRAMGESGRARARSIYDWSVVYRQYQELWAELAAIRVSAKASDKWQPLVASAPGCAPDRLDPFGNFGHYASQRITAETLVTACARPDGQGYDRLAASPLYSYADGKLCDPVIAGRILAAAQTPVSVAALAQQLGMTGQSLLFPVAMLGKMGLLRLSQ